MELINEKILKDLIKVKDNPCISIYTPTHKEWDKLQHDKTQFKNQVNEVKKQLVEKKFDEDEIYELIKNCSEFLSSDHFWQHQNLGLAVFISPNNFQYYRLPLSFETYINISDSFYVKPLIPLLSGNEQYFLLSIELSNAELYLGSKNSLSKITLPNNTPKSLEEALQFDDPEKSIQFHTTSSSSSTDTAAVFHGQGSGSDEKRKKKEILRYYQMLSKGLMEKIGIENAPLITIGVEYLHPIYREANPSPNLTAKIDIDPQSLTEKEIQKISWDKIEGFFQNKKEKAIEEFGRKEKNDFASTDIHKIVTGSFHQRIDKLFIDIKDSKYGRYNSGEDKLHIDNKRTPQNEDLHNLTIIKTLENNGSVFNLDRTQIPGNNSIAAVFRY